MHKVFTSNSSCFLQQSSCGHIPAGIFCFDQIVVVMFYSHGVQRVKVCQSLGGMILDMIIVSVRMLLNIVWVVLWGNTDRPKHKPIQHNNVTSILIILRPKDGGDSLLDFYLWWVEAGSRAVLYMLVMKTCSHIHSLENQIEIPRC